MNSSPDSHLEMRKEVERVTNLQKVADFEHLYAAHKKCRLGKQDEKATVRFELNLGVELVLLQKQLLEYTYRLGPYHEFVVHDPKERCIQALSYKDRVVQHSLCDNVLQPTIEPKLIYDNSACRIGKGTDFARERLTLFLRRFYRKYGSKGYILKYDVRKYFDSIHHQVLYEQLVKLFSDDREICGLLKMIIDSYETAPNRGLPMGNQSSQWFGLLYLNGLDHFIKEKLRIRFYTRYMDDGILLSDNKEYLKECLEKMRIFLTENLKIEFNEKTQIVPMSQGVDYLGFHFYLTNTGKVIRKLRSSNKKRLKRKLKHYKRAYRDGKIELDAITRSLTSYRGHLAHGDTHALQKNLLKSFVLTRGKKEEPIG